MQVFPLEVLFKMSLPVMKYSRLYFFRYLSANVHENDIDRDFKFSVMIDLKLKRNDRELSMSTFTSGSHRK